VLEPRRVEEVYRLPASRVRSAAGRAHLVFADTDR
jgi:hypothetical protein